MEKQINLEKKDFNLHPHNINIQNHLAPILHLYNYSCLVTSKMDKSYKKDILQFILYYS